MVRNSKGIVWVRSAVSNKHKQPYHCGELSLQGPLILEESHQGFVNVYDISHLQ